MSRGVLREIANIESRQLPVRALCLDADPQLCVDQALAVTGRPWQTTADRCGAQCGIIEIVPRQEPLKGG